MAAEYKHKRYFRIRGAVDHDPAETKAGTTIATEIKTFSSVADAKTKIGFKAVYDTSSPTKTEVLEDSGQTLVVTYEFNTEDEQTAFKTALHDAYADGYTEASDPGHFTPADTNHIVEHFKTEWLHADGSVSSTVNDIE